VVRKKWPRPSRSTPRPRQPRTPGTGIPAGCTGCFAVRTGSSGAGAVAVAVVGGDGGDDGDAAVTARTRLPGTIGLAALPRSGGAEASGTMTVAPESDTGRTITWAVHNRLDTVRRRSACLATVAIRTSHSRRRTGIRHRKSTKSLGRTMGAAARLSCTPRRWRRGSRHHRCP